MGLCCCRNIFVSTTKCVASTSSIFMVPQKSRRSRAEKAIGAMMMILHPHRPSSFSTKQRHNERRVVQDDEQGTAN